MTIKTFVAALAMRYEIDYVRIYQRSTGRAAQNIEK